MSKILFTLKIDNVIDIITNSSSELFVLKADSFEIVKELIESVYPGYLNEYYEPIQPKDMTPERFASYIDWINGWNVSKENAVVYEGFTFEDMYVKSRYGQTNTYVMKEGFIENNFETIVKLVDPGNKTWLMYSIDDNPDYEMQERLEIIAERYHLG